MPLYEASFVSRVPQDTQPPILTELGPVKFTGLSWTDNLLGAPTLDVGAKIESLDTSIRARLRELDRTPNEIWLHRNGTRVFAGPLTSIEIQNKRTITMHAFGLESYLDYMIRDIDYTATDVDQGLIAKELLDDYQAQSYGHFGLDTNVPETGTPRDLSVRGGEDKTLTSIIRTMGNRDNGFDFTVDPFSRRVTLYAPRRGIDKTATIVIDRRSIVLPRVMLSVAAGIFGTYAAVAASSVSGGTLTSSASDAAALARFGRVMVTAQWSDIDQQDTLDDHATRLVADAASPAFVVSPELAPITGLQPGDVNPGDLVTYDYDAGLGEQSLTRRAAKIQTTVRRGKERIAVTFL